MQPVVSGFIGCANTAGTVKADGLSATRDEAPEATDELPEAADELPAPAVLQPTSRTARQKASKTAAQRLNCFKSKKHLPAERKTERVIGHVGV